MVERLFLVVPQGCLRSVIVVFPDHTHYFEHNHVIMIIQKDGMCLNFISYFFKHTLHAFQWK